MRAKTFKLNGRANTTCSICGKRLPSAAALRAHKNSEHTVQAKSVTRSGKSRVNHTIVKRKKAVKTSKQQLEKLKSDIVSSPLVILNKNIKSLTTSSLETSENHAANEPSELQEVNVSKNKLTQFECPLCDKLFPIYFSAFKHVQKFHCINSKGETVKPSSKDLIKPIRIEICNSCKGKIYPPQPHTCTNSLPYTCSGCNKNFANVKLFDIHISKIHLQGIESLFFPSLIEFSNWKDHMEMQTSVKYLLRGKYENKQYYGCTTTPSTNQKDEKNLICLCPSAIVTQEFVKGVQAHFYPLHHGHVFKKFVLGQKFKKYSISSFMESTEVDITNVIADDNDLYIQFKTLMESIVLDSAKINIDTLRILVGKALEMTSVLNNYNEDDENENKMKNNTNELVLTTNRSLSDLDISKALEGLRSSSRLKRKPSVDLAKANEAKINKEIKAKNVLQLNKELAKVCADLNDSELNIEPSKQNDVSIETIDNDSSNNNKMDFDDFVTPLPKRRKSRKHEPVSQKKDVKSQKQELENQSPHIVSDAGEEISKSLLDKNKSENIIDTDLGVTPSLKLKDEKELTINSQDVKEQTLVTKDAKELTTLRPKDIKELTTLKPKDIKELTLKPKDIKELMQIPSSFNDSYKEFVEQCKGPINLKSKNGTIDSDLKQTQKTPTLKTSTLKTPNLNTSLLKPLTVKAPKSKSSTLKRPKAKPVKKKVLKTKMGHFTPNSSPKKLINSISKTLSPIYNDLTQIPIVKAKAQKPKILKSVNEIPSPKIKTTHVVTEASPYSIKQMGKSWTPPKKSLTPLQSPIIKKSLSNKSLKSPKSVLSKPGTPNRQPDKNTSETNVTKIKIDRYEVKEQENDCNILILKI